MAALGLPTLLYLLTCLFVLFCSFLFSGLCYDLCSDSWISALNGKLVVERWILVQWRIGVEAHCEMRRVGNLDRRESVLGRKVLTPDGKAARVHDCQCKDRQEKLHNVREIRPLAHRFISVFQTWMALASSSVLRFRSLHGLALRILPRLFPRCTLICIVGRSVVCCGCGRRARGRPCTVA